MTIVLQFELFSIPGASCLMQKRVESSVIPPVGTLVVITPALKAPVKAITWDLNTDNVILQLNMGQVTDANWTIEELRPLGWAVAREHMYSQ